MTDEMVKTGAPGAPCESDLEELGFIKAAEDLKVKREMARKMRIAFEHFRVVTPDAITRFNEDLRKRTTKTGQFSTYSYQRLRFTPIAQYGQIPPTAALEALRAAKGLKCFDAFEVADIESVQVIPDPILFGVITGCENKYFIAQWDEDVKIEDILKPDEG